MPITATKLRPASKQQPAEPFLQHDIKLFRVVEEVRDPQGRSMVASKCALAGAPVTKLTACNRRAFSSVFSA
jgi:hypothetical protein